MSSLKMTFSLTSLIFLIALGLVFAPTSVMAHEVTPANSGTGQVHNTDTPVRVVDTNGQVTTRGNTNHNAHPTVTSIKLKPGSRVRGNMAVVTDPAADGGTAADAQFTLVVTFDQPVVSTNDLLTVAADVADPTADPLVDNTVLAAADFGNRITNGDNSASTATVAIADATRVEDTDDQFEAVVTISAAFPSGMADDADKELTFRAWVVARAAFSLKTDPPTAQEPIAGGASELSSVYPFTLVKTLDPVTLESAVAETGATLAEPFDVTFTFSEAVTLEEDDIDVTGDPVAGAITDGPTKADDPDDGTVWIVEVTALASAKSITVAVNSPLESGTEITEGDDYEAATVAAPAKPTGVGATANNDDNTIRINWDDDDDADSYIVKKSYTDPDDDTATITKIVSGDGLDESHLVIPPAGAEPLMQGVEFSFTVIAVNAVGESEESDAATAELTEDPNTPPKFEASSHPTSIKLWVGLGGNDTWAPMDADGEIIFLPRATDVLNDEVDYELEGELPTGIQVLENDRQDRWVEVSKDAAAGTYTYTFEAIDQHGTKSSNPFSFSIVLDDPIKPTAPTNVMAWEEGRVANPLDRVVNDNKVVTSWDEPKDTSGKGTSHSPLIPFGAKITEYKVQWNVKNMSLDADDHYLVTEKDHKAEFDARESTTRGDATKGGELPIARYEFQVSAMNKVGYGDLSEKTDDSEVLVANPPSIPTDLGEGDERVTPTTITLNWLASADTGLPRGEAAPAYTPDPPGTEVTDGATSYYLYQTFNNVKSEDPIATQGADATAAPITDTTHQLSELKAGDYVFRVIAVNFDGFSAESLLSRHQVLVDPAPSTDKNPPVWRESGAAIASITDAVVDTPIDGITLPEAQANGDAITYTLEPELSAESGLSFNANTRYLSGTPKEAMARTAYTYKATSAGGSIQLNFEIEVSATEKPADMPPVVVASGTSEIAGVYDATANETVLSGTIAANGFGILLSNELPDLKTHFETDGGTIVLDDGGEAAAKTVVISEILWGYDLSASLTMRNGRQFVELYNTNMTGDIDLTGWKLKYSKGRPPLANDVDRISNVTVGGWIVDIGNSGSVTGTTADGGGTSAPVNIVSMYRNINYAKVQNTDGGDVAKRLDGVPDGAAKGSWIASKRSTTQAGIYASPGARHFVGGSPTVSPTTVPYSPVIINEIGNSSTAGLDWIELRNVSTDAVNLKNWEISEIAGAKDSETRLVHFPNDTTIPANGILLIVASDPYDDSNHPVAAGVRINGAHLDTTGVQSQYYVDDGFELTADAKTLLVLRNHHEKKNTADHIIDITGNLYITDESSAFSTKYWPLKATGAGNADEVFKDAPAQAFREGYVYKRAVANAGSAKHTWAKDAYTGVGYKRSANNADRHGGTPGYDNGVVKEFNDATVSESAAPVTISEVMYETGRNLPQWFELYNSSRTEPVRIADWTLKFENADDADVRTPAVTTNKLPNMTIQPNQTLLVVSTTIGRNSGDFPSARVLDLWTSAKDKLEVTNRRYQLLSTESFRITLADKAGKMVDTVGNMDEGWELPKSEEGSGRSSIIRRYGDTTQGVVDAHDPERDGTLREGWIAASETNLSYIQEHTYYGSSDDQSTPGFRGGGPLPVSLSKFRPERLEDTGEIVVRWITESELNNAGFNILRSEKRDGEFTKVHFEAGKGTTSERQVYEWKDTTATKPNVIYYYQIQDVSLDGEVTTLRTTHLRGNVTAVGKATTTWGEIKALQ